MHTIPGPITMASASKALADLCRAIDAGETEIAAGALVRSDSSAVAVLLAAIRHGQGKGKVVRVDGLPASLQSLARVYGVEALITGNTPAPAGTVLASSTAPHPA